jgi:RNA polymerase sigma-70 factor (ECF subfamily)
MEDSRIIDLYWKRSEEAITESDRKYGRYCGTIAMNILGNREDVEECVSDTWLRAWNAIPPARPLILKAFLGKITRNLSLNMLEKSRAGKRGGGEGCAVLDELEEWIADEGADTWSADRYVLTETLKRFLSTLPEEKRVIFVRRYWYMDQVKTIADDLGVGESKVKMTLFRVRKELAQVLKKEGITP